MNIDKIRFPIGAKKAAELLKANHRTLKKYCKELDIPIVGNSYCIFRFHYESLKKILNTS